MMNDSAANLGIASRYPAALGLAESTHALANRAGRGLIVETVLVTSAVTLVIRLLAQTQLSATLWFLIPTVLVTAALLPPIIRKGQFAAIGLNANKARQAITLLAPICLIAFGATSTARVRWNRQMSLPNKRSISP